MNGPTDTERLKEALDRLAIAERELTAAMTDLEVSSGVEKRFVSERLRVAFAELASAKAVLAEAVLADATPSPDPA